VRVVTLPGLGPPAAHNAGVRQARGRLVAFLDADDLWAAERPDPRRPELEHADVVWGRVQCWVNGQTYGPPFHHGALSGLLIRRRALDAVGPFDETLLRGHDFDWLLRAREAGLRIVRTDAIAYHYRLRHGSLSAGPGVRAAPLLTALSRSLKRRKSPA
jgi:glycosyltransferase involved in cell wall biosynthesis